jgi:Flp pilus assembly protein TadG
MRPTSPAGRRARGTAERGAAAVEAALVLPLVFLLTFVFIETAILLRDYSAVANLARDASRIASANPRFGTPPGHRGTDPNQSSFALLAAQAVEASGSALPKNSIRDMWVYLANADGFPAQSVNWVGDTTSSFASCPAATCVRYAWEDGSPGSFAWRSGVWDPATINACPNEAAAMSVGVFIRVEHTAVTHVLPGSLTITDRSVVKFEPRPPDSCKPLPPPTP